MAPRVTNGKSTGGTVRNDRLVLTWKLLIVWEIILCELNVNGRDLSGEVVKFPTAGKECRRLLTGLSSCRHLHNHKRPSASMLHPQ